MLRREPDDTLTGRSNQRGSGAALDIVCSECGSYNPSELRECSYCHTALPMKRVRTPAMAVSPPIHAEPRPPAVREPRPRVSPPLPVAAGAAATGAEKSTAAAMHAGSAVPAHGVVADAGTVRRYHIIVGDTCPVCRAASRISFSRERPPQIPLAGCQEAGGCRCALPIFAEELQAALSTPERLLAGIGLARVDEPPSTGAAQLEEAPSAAQQPRPGVPDWAQPAPITERRHHDLADLTTEYYQRRIQGIRIRTQSGCCRVCADVSESIYEPSAVPTLPVVGCQHGWYCTCMYDSEALPLDARGQAALETLARQERDSALRRRGISRFAPRPLHEAVFAFSIVLAAAAIWQYAGGMPAGVWEVLLPLSLALVCGTLAIGAIVRLRWVIAPAFIDAVSGIVVMVVAVRTAVQFRWPAGLQLDRAEDLRRGHLLLTLSGYGLDSLPAPERLIAAAGLAIFVAGLAGLILGPGYQQRAVLRESEVRDVRYSRRLRASRARPRTGTGKPVLALHGIRGRRGG
jgi:hypothetical protein